MVGRIAYQKIPPSSRGGEPFESTWESFLKLIFIPKYKKLIKKGEGGKMASSSVRRNLE